MITLIAKKLSESLNTFYKKIQDHNYLRRFLFKKNTKSYHFWAGSLVTCQLKLKDYSNYLSVKLSHGVGMLYEMLSDENFIKNSRDESEHLKGARFIIQYCK